MSVAGSSPLSTKADRASSSTMDHELRGFVGYNMRVAFLRIREDLVRTIEPSGLRVMTFSALGIVHSAPDLTQTQLAKALRIERSGVVAIVDELENARLIARHKVAGDRRSHALRLTPMGEEIWAKNKALVEAHEKEMLAMLSAEEQEQLRVLLQRVAHGALEKRAQNG